MPFEIDTGTRTDFGRIDKVQIILDAAQDKLGPDADQADIDAEVARMIAHDLLTPRKLETVRRHLVQFWPLIAPMAERSPASFDAVLMAFAEAHTDLC